ncbi:hypothetical protein PPERSA_04374 [Pseudocohnilembus persalinus]|uniref:Tetratricopeptide repeat protein n=1 Tax=Pseudocohnilembus persalinus TaxID=266149 RepID=A0A0V0QQJ9_PSEPJ|nr:hypothetical protein PPERSA_04374 [Pseudocohnilembus persalinus]|eukprot:KRX04559.1 hypothetical protein PPERSA_04374 [Pseudocohnilembus persalinus]
MKHQYIKQNYQYEDNQNQPNQNKQTSKNLQKYSIINNNDKDKQTQNSIINEQIQDENSNIYDYNQSVNDMKYSNNLNYDNMQETNHSEVLRNSMINNQQKYENQKIYSKFQNLVNNGMNEIQQKNIAQGMIDIKKGCYYRRIGDLQTAINILEQAEELVLETGFDEYAGLTYLNLSAIKSQIQDNNSSKHYSVEAINQFQEKLKIYCQQKVLSDLQKDQLFLELAQNLSMSYYNLAISYQKMGEINEAKNSMENSVKVAFINLGEKHALSQSERKQPVSQRKENINQNNNNNNTSIQKPPKPVIRELFGSPKTEIRKNELLNKYLAPENQKEEINKENNQINNQSLERFLALKKEGVLKNQILLKNGVQISNKNQVWSDEENEIEEDIDINIDTQEEISLNNAKEIVNISNNKNKAQQKEKKCSQNDFLADFEHFRQKSIQKEEYVDQNQIQSFYKENSQIDENLSQQLSGDIMKKDIQIELTELQQKHIFQAEFDILFDSDTMNRHMGDNYNNFNNNNSNFSSYNQVDQFQQKKGFQLPPIPGSTQQNNTTINKNQTNSTNNQFQQIPQVNQINFQQSFMSNQFLNPLVIQQQQQIGQQNVKSSLQNFSQYNYQQQGQQSQPSQQLQQQMQINNLPLPPQPQASSQSLQKSDSSQSNQQNQGFSINPINNLLLNNTTTNNIINNNVNQNSGLENIKNGNNIGSSLQNNPTVQYQIFKLPNEVINAKRKNSSFQQIDLQSEVQKKVKIDKDNKFLEKGFIKSIQKNIFKDGFLTIKQNQQIDSTEVIKQQQFQQINPYSLLQNQNNQNKALNNVLKNLLLEGISSSKSNINQLQQNKKKEQPNQSQQKQSQPLKKRGKNIIDTESDDDFNNDQNSKQYYSSNSPSQSNNNNDKNMEMDIDIEQNSINSNEDIEDFENKNKDMSNNENEANLNHNKNNKLSDNFEIELQKWRQKIANMQAQYKQIKQNNNQHRNITNNVIQKYERSQIKSYVANKYFDTIQSQLHQY